MRGLRLMLILPGCFSGAFGSGPPYMQYALLNLTTGSAS